MIFKYKIALIFFTGFLLTSCGEETLVPKPPTYLRNDLPQPVYKDVNPDCPYRFELNQIYSYKDVFQAGKKTCHKDIDLGPLNGSIHFSYISITEPLKSYIDYALSKVEEHQIKANEIIDQQVIRKNKKVYGTFFELKGDVASPFQFYLTDSVNHFVSGAIYFNAKPNYDSLRPSLDYLKRDILKLMNSLEWK